MKYSCMENLGTTEKHQKNGTLINFTTCECQVSFSLINAKKSAKCNVAKRCQSVCCLSHTRAVGFWIRILMHASSNRSG